MLGIRISGSWLKSAALGILVAMSPLVTASGGASGVPKPVIQKAKGDKCVEDTDYMRRNHMKLLNHHRDKTMHEGIRTRQHSLKNCIDCHASPDASGKETVLGKDHFCQSCHSYAAVSIDCFQCHSSKPAGNSAVQSIMPAQTGPHTQSSASLRNQGRLNFPQMNSTLSVKNIAGVIK
jgi:hypothetical protein